MRYHTDKTRLKPRKTRPQGFWKCKENQKQFLEDLKESLDIKDVYDWGRINYQDIRKAGGAGLLFHYPLYRSIFPSIYPDVDWNDVFLSAKSIPMYQQRSTLEKIAIEKNCATLEDWNRLTKADIIKLGGNNILKSYPCFTDMLQAVFPEKSIDLFAFAVKKLPVGFWDDIANQTLFIKKIEKKLNIKEPKDWAYFRLGDVTKYQGAPLRKYSSLKTLLDRIYPHVEWETIFCTYPRNHWRNKKNQRLFFDQLQKKLGFSNSHDLLFVDASTIRKYGGNTLLRKKSSYHELLKETYPEEDWFINSKEKAPRNYFTCKKNQKNLLESIGTQMGITQVDEWTFVSSHMFRQHGGSTILQYYPTFIDMLRFFYPEHDWDFTNKQRKLPPFYWDDFDNIKQFITKVEKKFAIYDKEDWYRVSIPQIIGAGGGGLLTKYRLYDILCKVYPDESWNEKRIISKNKKARQRWLYLIVKDMFPLVEVIEEFIINGTQRESGSPIELDVYIPDYRLAFEYNGEHHYKEIPAFGAMELYQERDEEKQRLCKEHQIDLVHVPYWWDDSVSSLKQFINISHPSLLHQIYMHNQKNKEM